MKNLKKLLAVLAFCACLVIPFTACGGYNSGIVESYTYEQKSGKLTCDITIKFKNNVNLPESLYLLFVYPDTVKQFGSLDNYLSDKSVIRNITKDMCTRIYFSQLNGTPLGTYKIENNEINTGGDILKYILLYDYNDVPDNNEIIEQYVNRPGNISLLNQLNMMDLNKYIGFVDIVEVDINKDYNNF